MKQRALILFALAALISCHHNDKQVTEVNGSVSPSEIASDTLNQLAIEGSYEYSRTLPVAENLAFDIFAYGEPAEGDFIIIRRTDNKADTLIRSERRGIFEDVWLTRLNKNHKGEIVIVTRSVGDSSRLGNLLIYSIDNNNALTPVTYNPDLGTMMNGNDRGRDSFYVQGNQLIRQFPLYASDDANCCPTGGRIRVHYDMKNDALTEGNMDMDMK